MWKAVLKENVIKPVFRRLGTLGAGALMFGGEWACQHLDACGLVTEGGAAMVMQYVAAAALLAFDLSLAWLERKSVQRKASN